MDIAKLLDDSLLKEQGERKTGKRSGKFSPSSFGRCFRYQIWNRADVKVSDPIGINVLRIFKVGHMFHKFLQDIVEGEKEVLIEEDDVKGFADIVVEDEVIDLKTVRTRGFWAMKKQGYDMNAKNEDKILQVVYYAKQLGKVKARLVFVCKDDLAMLDHLVFVADWKEKLEQELKSLRLYWNNYTRTQQLPLAEPRAFGGYECKYCGFFTRCNAVEKPFIKNGTMCSHCKGLKVDCKCEV